MAGLIKKTAFTWAVTLILLASAQSLPALRIMPLGDSITKGSLSSDTTGYRRRLREKLLTKAPDVDMIGSLHDGNMIDSDHEGHSGEYLAEIAQYYKRSINARPNIVCIHAGTNNMDKQRDIDIAPDIFTSIINGIWETAPDATIVVTPVIWANIEDMNRRSDVYNTKIKSIIAEKQKDGKHILTASASIGLSDLADLKHPNDKGYEKMAVAWYNAILEANEKGWIKSPVKVDQSKLLGMGLGYGSTSGNGGASCEGGNWKKRAGIFDGVRSWESQGPIMDGVENGSRDKLHLVDLNNDKIADYVIVDNDGTIRAWINGGKPKQWTSLGKVNPKWSSDILKGGKIHFADVDNDGKADLIIVYSDGAAKVWKNTDNGKNFESLDAKWATGLEKDSQDKIRFKDIDGDGYADYITLDKGGQVKWARNTHNNGKDSNKKNWENVETVAPGPAGIPDNTARLYDLDGDGRADYVIVYNGGAVKALRNTVTNSGRNWDDLGTIAPGISGVTGDMIEFADMDGDGLADFLAVAEDGSIRMWKNTGVGISGRGKGASIQFADLTGDGKADIISVDKNGRAQAWLNKGVDQWESIGEIAPGLDEDLSSSRVEFIDVNGDKRADYLVIYGGGSVKAYLNNGNIPDKGKDRIWQQPITISPGVGEPGDKVRFADLNGDGYMDFLIVFDGGAVDAWLNQKNIPPSDGGRIWGSRSTVATGVRQPGSKVRFADINGDGKDDYIVQFDGGAADGYSNTGNIPNSGKERNWVGMGTIAGGVSDQGPVQYADIDGDGKADYLVVHDDGKVDAYINTCDWKPRGDPNVGGGNPGDPNVGGGDQGGGNVSNGGPRSTAGGGGGNGDPNVSNGGPRTTSTKGSGAGDPNVGEGTRTGGPSIPTDSSGRCMGPDCDEDDGQCTDDVCAGVDCKGKDCVGGHCIGNDCTPIGCVGKGCKRGKCIDKEKGCKTSGCHGAGCDSDGKCTGPSCVTIGCIGPQCKDSICIGPSCSVIVCWGPNCKSGKCVGSGCHPGGGASGGGSDAPPPPPEEPDGCTTKTWEACNTGCTYYSSTSSCKTRCTDVVACVSPTGVSISTTKTCEFSAPSVVNEWNGEEDDPDGELPGFGASMLFPGAQVTTAKPPPSKPTTTKKPAPTTKPTTKTPLERSEIKCWDEGDFPGHADISPSAQDGFAEEFSGLGTENVTPAAPAGLWISREDKDGIWYSYGAEWVKGCVLDESSQSQSFRQPLGNGGAATDITAYLLVRENFEKCKNGGVGGSCQVGCVNYIFVGGLGFDATFSKNKFFQGALIDECGAQCDV